MSIDTKITSKGNQALVNVHGSLCSVNQISEVPPVGSQNRVNLLSGYLGAVGFVQDKNSLIPQSNGLLPAANILQNGLGTVLLPLKYYVGASIDYDIVIQKVIFLHTWNKDNFHWGETGAVLLNGYQIKAFEGGNETFLANAKTSGEMVISSGAGSKQGELKKWVAVGKVDALIVQYDLDQMLPGGLRLGRGTTDRLECVVQDDMTLQVDQFCFVLGYRHYA